MFITCKLGRPATVQEKSGQFPTYKSLLSCPNKTDHSSPTISSGSGGGDGSSGSSESSGGSSGGGPGGSGK